MREPISHVFPCRGVPEAVAWRFGITSAALLSERRDGEVARPRQVAMWLCARVINSTQVEIAHYFRRDRSTVKQAIKHIDKLMKGDPVLAATVWVLAQRLDPDEAAILRSTMIRRVA